MECRQLFQSANLRSLGTISALGLDEFALECLCPGRRAPSEVWEWEGVWIIALVGHLEALSKSDFILLFYFLLQPRQETGLGA